jgi:hypothetical protein
MASLYKKPIVVTDSKSGQKIKTRSKKWWGRYRDDDGAARRAWMIPLKNNAANR